MINNEQIPQFIKPSEKYREFHTKFASSGKDEAIYVSHAISTGGFHSLEEMERFEGMKLNCELANQFFGLLVLHDFIPENVFPIRPSETFVSGWHDREYMTYFYMTICGLDPNLADEMESKIEENLSVESQIVLNNKSLPDEQREKAHLELQEIVLDLLNKYPGSYMPVTSLLQLLDNGKSHGSRAEEAFARRLEIPVFEFTILDLDHSCMDDVREAVLKLNGAGIKLVTTRSPHHNPNNTVHLERK